MLFSLGLTLVCVSLIAVMTMRGNLLRMIVYMELAFIGLSVCFTSAALELDDITGLGIVIVLLVFGTAESAVALGLVSTLNETAQIEVLRVIQR